MIYSISSLFFCLSSGVKSPFPLKIAFRSCFIYQNRLVRWDSTPYIKVGRNQPLAPPGAAAARAGGFVEAAKICWPPL